MQRGDADASSGPSVPARDETPAGDDTRLPSRCSTCMDTAADRLTVPSEGSFCPASVLSVVRGAIFCLDLIILQIGSGQKKLSDRVLQSEPDLPHVRIGLGKIRIFSYNFRIRLGWVSFRYQVKNFSPSPAHTIVTSSSMKRASTNLFGTCAELSAIKLIYK